MDSRFIKFWGHFLVRVAEGKEQFQYVAEWIEKGFKGSKTMNELLWRYYGLDRDEGGGKHNEIDAWQTAMTQFQLSLDTLCRNWVQHWGRNCGWIHQNKYEKLKKEHEALRQKVAEQKETIKTLRAILNDDLNESEEDQVAVFQKMHRLYQMQNRQFQELIQNMSQIYEK